MTSRYFSSKSRHHQSQPVSYCQMRPNPNLLVASTIRVKALFCIGNWLTINCNWFYPIYGNQLASIGQPIYYQLISQSIKCNLFYSIYGNKLATIGQSIANFSANLLANDFPINQVQLFYSFYENQLASIGQSIAIFSFPSLTIN